MLIGYRLSAHDDDSNMLGDSTYRAPGGAYHDFRFGVDGVPHPATCATCGRKTDPGFVSATYRVRKRKRDATATGDGYVLVSERFRKHCHDEGWPGAEFVRLPAEADFFWLRSPRVLKFDVERRQTRFEQFCGACNAYYAVVGARPVYLLDISAPLGEGFYHTDIEFGSGPEQHPLIIVGPETGRRIRDMDYAVLDVSPIEVS